MFFSFFMLFSFSQPKFGSSLYTPTLNKRFAIGIDKKFTLGKFAFLKASLEVPDLAEDVIKDGTFSNMTNSIDNTCISFQIQLESFKSKVFFIDRRNDEELQYFVVYRYKKFKCKFENTRCREIDIFDDN